MVCPRILTGALLIGLYFALYQTWIQYSFVDQSDNQNDKNGSDLNAVKVKGRENEKVDNDEEMSLAQFLQIQVQNIFFQFNIYISR